MSLINTNLTPFGACECFLLRSCAENSWKPSPFLFHCFYQIWTLFSCNLDVQSPWSECSKNESISIKQEKFLFSCQPFSIGFIHGNFEKWVFEVSLIKLEYFIWEISPRRFHTLRLKKRWPYSVALHCLAAVTAYRNFWSVFQRENIKFVLCPAVLRTFLSFLALCFARYARNSRRYPLAQQGHFSVLSNKLWLGSENYCSVFRRQKMKFELFFIFCLLSVFLGHLRPKTKRTLD